MEKTNWTKETKGLKERNLERNLACISLTIVRTDVILLHGARVLGERSGMAANARQSYSGAR